MPSRRRFPCSRGAALLVVGGLILGVIPGCTSARPEVSHRVGAGTAASLDASDRAAGPTPLTPPLSGESPFDAGERMLRSRAAAVNARARDGWLARVSGLSLRGQQGQMFDRMLSMGVIGLRLVSLTGLSPARAPTSTLTPSTGPGASTVRAGARFAYRLAGFDTADRTFDVDLSLRFAPSVDAQPQVVAWAPHDRPQPWDLSQLTVRRSATSLVLASSPELAADLLARAETAQSNVATVWGHARPAVWVAPTTDTEAARLLGREPVALRDVAAVTDGPLVLGRPAGADRVVIVPGAWSSLAGGGRDVVATHELTHVVVRGSTTGAVPLWLSEGFAELVAYRTVALPERDIVRPALEVARRSGLPTALPSASEFDPAAGGVPAAYGLSLLVVRTLAERDGVAAVVRFYREVADPSGGSRSNTVPTPDGSDQQHAVDQALASALQTNRAALVRAWRARVERLVS
ncbi:MAG: hypothetical protein ABIQ53_15795 [Terracoccus sp.]